MLALLIPSLALASMLALGREHSTTSPDLCSLLTEAEAETILSQKLEPPQPQKSGDCWYLREGGKDLPDVEVMLSVLPVHLRSEREFDDFVAEQVKSLNKAMKEAGGMEFQAQRVENVGAPAYFVDPGLYVLQGGRVLVIAADRPKAVAIAAKALPRFK
ncbi:MAG TPA: hypothetical protein VH763_02025 [Gemmatimonadales bacterium]